MVWGGKRYVTNVCMYAALFRLYSGIVTQTARRTCRKESVPTSSSLSAAMLHCGLRWVGNSYVRKPDTKQQRSHKPSQENNSSARAKQSSPMP